FRSVTSSFCLVETPYDRHRHGANAHRSDPGLGKIRRVVHEKEHAVAGTDAERGKRARGALHASGQLRVGNPLLAAEQRNAPAMARQGIVAEQEFGGVQASSGTSGSLRPSLSTACLARVMASSRISSF